ncbi:hypothetical protein CSC3H3_01660 [Thalassospira marina]|uniref:Uncharacterized protein n=1 Tax=Thalassospira marina TaxID=2048283 RepID=A0ABN5FC32_9PROT|nr:hypothetical protein CSC3H3_01660 [Thalassospira marina]
MAAIRGAVVWVHISSVHDQVWGFTLNNKCLKAVMWQYGVFAIDWGLQDETGGRCGASHMIRER